MQNSCVRYEWVENALVLTLNFLYFPLPWDASRPKIFKVPLKLYPFLYDETQSMPGKLKGCKVVDFYIFQENMSGVLDLWKQDCCIFNRNSNTFKMLRFTYSYLHHHNFVGIKLPAFPFAQSTFKFIHKLLSLSRHKENKERD